MNEKPVGYAPYPAGQGDPSVPPRKKTILGVPRTIFWVITGLVVLLVLGIALGAGLGVGLSNASKQSQTTSTATPTSTSGDSQTTSPPVTSPPSITPTSTATSTSSAPVTSGTTGLADNSCNFTTPKTYYAADGTGFTQYCFTDWPNKDAAADGVGNVTDLTYTTVYTFEACMQKCLDYNSRLTTGRTRCTAVTYNANLTSIIAIGQQGGNCFLKDKKGVNQQGSAESACAAIAD
jgi:hypothetical protein